jgi:hypothetical protein
MDGLWRQVVGFLEARRGELRRLAHASIYLRRP